MTSVGLGIDALGLLFLSWGFIKVSAYDRGDNQTSRIELSISRRELFLARFGLGLIVGGFLLQFVGAWLPQTLGGG